MGVKEGLLALLADGPKHGYQLKIDLEAATGDSISVNVGQVYSTLQRLERDHLVQEARTDNEGRVIYEITAAGIETLRDWVASPVDLAAAGRDEISIKVLISIATKDLDPFQVIESQRRATMSLLQDLTPLRATETGHDLAWQLHLDRLVYSAEAELKWLDRVEDRLNESKPTKARAKARAASPVEEGVK